MRWPIVCLCLFMLSPTLVAKTFKIGALVPEGTSWATNLKKMAKEISDTTDGRVKFKLYLGGVAGDEPVVMRKIRSGQFHGGIFTGKALGEVFGDVRLMEVPFNFVHDRSKAVKVLSGMQSHFDSGLEKEGFAAIGYFELGKVYIVSTKSSSSIEALKGSKIWAWEGDKLVEAIMNNLKLVSVPLALPDVLTSLSTGMIESAYATPLAIIALQWQDKVKYLYDFPVTYSIGGLLLSKKAWDGIDAKDRDVVKGIAAKWTKVTNDTTIAENQTSLSALKNKGISFVKFPQSDLERGKEIRRAVLCQLQGSLFSKAGVKLFESLMASSVKCS